MLLFEICIGFVVKKCVMVGAVEKDDESGDDDASDVDNGNCCKEDNGNADLCSCGSRGDDDDGKDFVAALLAFEDEEMREERVIHRIINIFFPSRI